TVTFLVGTAIGVGLGLLYAPKAGRKLNKDIKKVKDVVEDQAEIVAHSLRDAGNVVQDIVRKVANA
ncbi:MAG TPA: YtxH domain-containing protein, partial [Thermoanaerobaculia bacterium]|nr:YtxH domain-containing protein [Thermoanaerobaculia bacterium]